MIPSIERLKQAPSRLPRSLSYLTDLPNLYGDFISKNASSVSQIESALRSLTYIIPGMIKTFYSLTNMLSDRMFNQLIPCYLLGRFRESELASESCPSILLHKSKLYSARC